MKRTIAPANQRISRAKQTPSVRVPGTHTYIPAGAIVRQA
jgi:hypothetical protein